MSAKALRRIVFSVAAAASAAAALGGGVLAAPAPGEEPSSAPGSSAGAAAKPDIGPIIVSAAASLRDVLTTEASRFREAHPLVEVRLNFGASNLLARQIVQGAPVDLLISADARSMDAVERSGRLLPGSRFDFLTNDLVVIVPSDSAVEIVRAEDLFGSKVRRLALCDDAVPVGHYARSWLARRGGLDRLSEKIVRPDDVRAALAMVESGAVDAAFVYRTDAMTAKRSKVALEIPSKETPGIVYPAAVVGDGGHPRAAAQFLDFLRTPPAVWLFTEAGFGVVERADAGRVPR